MPLKLIQSHILNTGGTQKACYSQPGCVGDIVTAPGPSARDCCAGTDDGQSYSDDGVNCFFSQCVGMYSNHTSVIMKHEVRKPFHSKIED